MDLLKKYGLNKEDWFYYGQWEQPPISAAFWVNWYNEKICREMGLPVFNGGLIMINGHTVVNKGDLHVLQAKFREACDAEDTMFFQRINNTSMKVFNKHAALVEKLRKTSDEKLFHDVLDFCFEAIPPWFVSVVLSDYAGDVLAQKAEEKGLPLSRILSFIPHRETLMLKQHREVVEIKQKLQEKNLLGLVQNNVKKSLIEIKKYPELWRKIEKHVEEFEWVGTHHFWGDPLTIEKLLREAAIAKHVQEEPVEGEVPRDLQFLANVSGDTQFLRTYSPEVFDLVVYRAKNMLTKIAANWNLTYEELLLLTGLEIKEHLKNETQPNKEGLLKRKTGAGILKVNGSELVICDAGEITEFEKLFAPQADTNVTQFSGVIANKGYGRGRAKVFLVPENLQKMQEGDVLVTPMTTPDFVPLMKKAAAIVTDIGGLLSHAGIISRELGKPCVIGTKVATKVLRDGDLVEVDAVKGIVKKLS